MDACHDSPNIKFSLYDADDYYGIQFSFLNRYSEAKESMDRGFDSGIFKTKCL